jgi:hypothetical protein
MDTISLWISRKLITDYYLFNVQYDYEVSPKVRCGFAANVVYRSMDIFSKDYAFLADIIHLLNY